jgi:hypothetical protein
MSQATLTTPIFDDQPGAAVLARLDIPRSNHSDATTVGQPPHDTATDDPIILKSRSGRFAGIDDVVERMTPQADPQDEDLAYRRLLRDLHDEYQVDGPSAEFLLATLAADMLQVARFRQAINILQYLDELNKDELAHYEKHRQNMADLFAATSLQILLAEGLDLNAERGAGERLAARMALRVNGCYLDLVSDKPSEEDRANWEEFDHEQFDETRQLGELVLPHKNTLGDAGILVDLLVGERQPTVEERTGLAALLDWVVPVLRWTRSDFNIEACIRRYRKDGCAKLCHDPEVVRQILLLDSGVRQISKAIKDAVALLSKQRPSKHKAR